MNNRHHHTCIIINGGVDNMPYAIYEKCIVRVLDKQVLSTLFALNFNVMLMSLHSVWSLGICLTDLFRIYIFR